ncbi:TetR/AcrR family transcriptional regulator [Deinococcus altitudinis]|uniref:TetR/AcrR family transcriptional regulator n=1 Tax=Deinococcus altitudinis TaxID=468914 RepID=UPI003891FA6F
MNTDPHSPSDAPPTQSAVDPRTLRSQTTVLTTTIELLNERGLGGVSIDEISRRSGVAKTTIYRHWPIRADLLLDACARLITPMTVPDTGGFQTDLTAALTQLAQLLETARWSHTLPSVIDAAERDPDLARVLSRLQHSHMTPFLEIVDRALSRQEIVPLAEPSALIASMLGPLYYRRWFTHEPLSPAFLKGVVETVMARALAN